MLHFLALATSESDTFTPPTLCFECRSLPFNKSGDQECLLSCFAWICIRFSTFICTHPSQSSTALPSRTAAPFRWDAAVVSRCITELTQLVPSDLSVRRWKQRPDEAELKLLIGGAALQN